MLPDQYRRRKNSYRKPGHDYNQPARYFITIETINMVCMFGHVENGIVYLNKLGLLAEKFWKNIPSLYINVVLDAFIVMPNHLHGIIIITDTAACIERSIKPPSLSDIVRRYKASTTRAINYLQHTGGESIWKQNYHDRIIPDKITLNAPRIYIQNNPLKWNASAWPDRDD